MQRVKALETENLIRAMGRDCQHQAETAYGKLQKVIECLRDDNHLAALGSFLGLDEEILYISVVLKRLSRLSASTLTHTSTQKPSSEPAGRPEGSES